MIRCAISSTRQSRGLLIPRLKVRFLHGAGKARRQKAETKKQNESWVLFFVFCLLPTSLSGASGGTADALGLGPSAARHGGSNPSLPRNGNTKKLRVEVSETNGDFGIGIRRWAVPCNIGNLTVSDCDHRHSECPTRANGVSEGGRIPPCPKAVVREAYFVRKKQDKQ